ncbi:uncharacterized protein LOC126739934 isoform X2 [Anthonomus grandis grandis]|uniref:uncharacterized protein LOC126739934 isoform X2 n=1 Tax=Anthonomus grandis grandis TaxID=2921223 RepID=UPI002165DEFB|nr:uncharacterized protein LOC126739934 isoform X2 [Anthonomus grandis grandis]
MESQIQQEPTNDSKYAVETLLLILPSFFYMVYAVVLSSLLSHRSKTSLFLIEFLVIVVPVIANVTVLSQYVTNVVVITCFILGFHLVVSLLYMRVRNKKTIKTANKNTENKKDYITNCRATINLISVVAILAVDFKIFPSKYSKTLKTGFSLMDVGVGLYVFANGIVAPEVRGKKDSIKSSIFGSALLILIGLLRLVLTKLTHYRVSDTEYGVHWNFFMTLGFAKITSSFILNVFSLKYVWVNAVLITISHETLLQLSFKHWVFDSDDRSNILNANKEGLVSYVGFAAIYLFSVYFAYNIRQAERNYRNVNLRFLLITCCCLTMTFFCNYHFEVSRRLANAGYIFWILFIGFFMTWLFFLAEKGQHYLFKNKIKNYVCSPYLYEAINYNGLIFFLVGNVLTGLINLSITTSRVGNMNALMILVVYMFINCGVVYWFYRKQWKLKL